MQLFNTTSVDQNNGTGFPPTDGPKVLVVSYFRIQIFRLDLGYSWSDTVLPKKQISRVKQFGESKTSTTVFYLRSLWCKCSAEKSGVGSGRKGLTPGGKESSGFMILSPGVA